METFIEARTLVPDPDYADRRRAYVRALDLESIDTPIVRLVDCLNKTHHCFTLQSCFGHFL
jgi:tRNA(Phe) wybutosine-synthesizing methylase Tyw3